MKRIITYFCILVFITFPHITKAKEITLVIHSTKGQPFVNAKILMDYMKTHIPNVEKINVKEISGASGINVANYMHNVNKDHYTIATFFKTTPYLGFTKNIGVRFDPLNFFWIGSTSDGRIDVTLLIAKNLDKNRVIHIGDLSETNSIVDLIQSIIPYNVKIVKGYKTRIDIQHAFETNEIDAFINNYYSLKYSKPQILKNNRILVQIGNGYNRGVLSEIPTLMELATTNDERLKIDTFENQLIVARPFFMSPNTPKDIVEIFRNAFKEATHNQEYIQKANSLGIDVTPIYSDEIVAILKRTKKLITPNQ